MDPKSWRKSCGLTLKNLSRLMDGLSPSYLSQVERHEIDPSGRTIRAYYKLSKGQVKPDDFKKQNT